MFGNFQFPKNAERSWVTQAEIFYSESTLFPREPRQIKQRDFNISRHLQPSSLILRSKYQLCCMISFAGTTLQLFYDAEQNCSGRHQVDEVYPIGSWWPFGLHGSVDVCRSLTVPVIHRQYHKCWTSDDMSKKYFAFLFILQIDGLYRRYEYG